VGGITTTDRQLWRKVDEVLEIPILVRVAKHEIKRAFKGPHQVMGISEARIDIRRNAGLPEILDGDRIAAPVNLDGGNFAARLCCGLGEPDR
jgi:hypothetical protein